MSSTTYAATLRRRYSPIRTYPRRNACKLAFTLPTRNPAARLHDSWWSTLSGRHPSRFTANPSFFCERLLPHLCVVFPYPTLPASRVRYGKRYETWLLSRKKPQVRKTLRGYTPLALTVALVEPGLSTGL